MTHTPDLANLFAKAAVDLPNTAMRQSIDVGWSRPIEFQEVVAIVASKLDRKNDVLRLFSLLALHGHLYHWVV